MVANDRLAAVIDPAGRTWRIEYDALGPVTRRTVDWTDAAGAQHSTAYVEFNDSAEPPGGFAHCTRMTVRTDFPTTNPVVTRYHYDTRGNLRVIEYAWNDSAKIAAHTVILEVGKADRATDRIDGGFAPPTNGRPTATPPERKYWRPSIARRTEPTGDRG